MSLVHLLDIMRRSELAFSGSPESRLTAQEIQALTSNLPQVTESDVKTAGHIDSVCPICFNTFLSILAEEETALALDSPAHPVEELGVTKLHKTCGHFFCRRDIKKWIGDGNDSCPSCRTPFIPGSRGPRDESPLPPQVANEFLQQFIVESTAAPINPIMPPHHLPTLAVTSDEMYGHRETRRRNAERSEYSGMYS
ncbi:hypothetical protein BJ138DRAFT_682743 [Hygrophoropsis aurantiaca]|uniref:Uncharacterized protein n=1 Tax=Hygrophoropsis aurantiaca TaxID=72124 RepID=A0ACB8AS94_9AGAM|nr:hypothetical protein BJ138DRAFT_682743 [Hygrophoropsis aurantiaca]